MADEVLVIPPERAGLELDEYLCLQFPSWSKGFARRQVRRGSVLVDGVPAHPSQRLRCDQVLQLDVDEEPPVARRAPGDELVVLHEEADWLALDKPSGLPVEPERWEREGRSLAGLLAERGDDGPDAPRLRIVHRLDKGTSGVLLVAKTVDGERRLRSAFDGGAVRKTYLALVEGEHPLADGASETIELALAPDRRRSGRIVPAESGGKPARTVVLVEERFRGYTLLRCHPETGRTHQIRVHLAHAGFPLAVDPVYGRRDALLLSSFKSDYRAKAGRPERPLIHRLTLHALAIEVPAAGVGGDGAPVRVEAPLPHDFQVTLKQLAKHREWVR